ncbi:MAG: zinc ribbon domain-containing protein, partial [Corynebacterium sp.]|uniref:zinc ribbon domain-containing protein n=1 Tax=Corynebacterium sp. TaxID=1720 RepID=UPI0026493E2D
RQLLMNPRNKGIRTHNGTEIGLGTWDPIVDERLWLTVAELTLGVRKSSGGGPRRHMLTGVAVCMECGSPVKVATRKRNGGSKYAVYVCRDNHCASAPVDVLDTVISGIVRETFVSFHADAIAEAEQEHEEQHPVQDIDREKVQNYRDRIAEARQMWLEGDMSKQEWLNIKGEAEQRIETLAQAVPSVAPTPGLVPFYARVIEGWETLQPQEQGYMAQVVTDTIGIRSPGKGKRFGIEHIVYRAKGSKRENDLMRNDGSTTDAIFINYPGRN